MSTTPRNPDGLSVNFADNIGADQMVVYSGPLHFYETEAEKYDIHIPITPFAYNPSAGNLLIDIFNHSTVLFRRDPDWLLDSADRFSDSVSRVSGGPTDQAGALVTVGLMTRFTYTPIPEPSTWALLVTGVVVFGVFGWKRRVLGRKQGNSKDWRKIGKIGVTSEWQLVKS